jgi:hypothetical protein
MRWPSYSSQIILKIEIQTVLSNLFLFFLFLDGHSGNRVFIYTSHLSMLHIPGRGELANFAYK